MYSFELTDNGKKGYGNGTCVHWVSKKNMMHATKHSLVLLYKNHEIAT